MIKLTLLENKIIFVGKYTDTKCKYIYIYPKIKLTKEDIHYYEF